LRALRGSFCAIRLCKQLGKKPVCGVTQKDNASKARPELRGQTANDY
jgi:hypothetical protein